MNDALVERLAGVPDFIGSSALATALHETYVEHIGVTETVTQEGATFRVGGYIWCACGWRSDDDAPGVYAGNAYAIHLTNALHAVSVKALQEVGVVRRSDLLPVVEQEIAAARAEALREAADRMPAWGNSGALEFAQDWLRDRAARIARTAAQAPATRPEEGR